MNELPIDKAEALVRDLSPDEADALALMAKAVSNLNRKRRRAYYSMRSKGVPMFDAYRRALS